jgi:DNA-binding NtrC family response regulator
MHSSMIGWLLGTVATRTLTGIDDGSDALAEVRADYLTIAFDCAHPIVPPARLLLDVPEVIIGRGARRSWRRSAGTLRIELPDSSISGDHARLVRDGPGWRLEDTGSKNGTVLRGERITGPMPLADRALIELGGNMLVFRSLSHTGTPRDDVGAVPSASARLPATLHTPWSAQLTTLLRVARSGSPVVLLGATGTGKEVVARAIHIASGRAGPFVPVNCAAIAKTLVESELFGAVKGAFTGAVDHRHGLVRAADGGTLFLDEVAELPEQSQAALLRVLQEREVLPVGATRAVPIDLRVIAATHEDLAARVAEGRFRTDLHSRLVGYVAQLPPLRDRLEDIGALIAELLLRVDEERANRVRFSRAAARALFTHAWPYNVRELEQTLNTALAIATADSIGVAELPAWAHLGTSEAAAPASAERHDPAASERERIIAALDECAGNQTRAAKKLGISRATLATKLAIHRLPRPRK